MNKKILVLSILIASLCILLVLGSVFLLNRDQRTVPKETGDGAENKIVETVVEEYTDSKSFLNDNDFLDEYQPNFDDKVIVQKKKASMLVSSVAKDIRINIVDAKGKKITGVPFYVKVENVGEYKDLDKDGYIYIAGLKPGTYDVSLKDSDDYACDNDITIEVAETVAYSALDDIMYSIVTEKDINVSEEDTKQADVYRDDTENTKAYKSTDAVDFGIDVSAWQKEIDWEKVKASGVDFAIIRCGYRGAKTGALVEDSYFYRNLTKAKEAGIDVGVYFFTQAVNETEAVEEASMVLALVGDTVLEYPIFIDTENTNGRADGLDKKTRTAVCDAFCRTIENSGKEAGIYASRNWFINKLNDNELSDHKRWVAEYASTTAYAGRYEMWQYTSSGSINGIEGRVDLDVSYKDF